MSERFFIARTSEPQNGVALFIGHNIGKHYAMAFCLDEQASEQVEFGHVIHVDLDGDFLMCEDVGLKQATLVKVEADRPHIDVAVKYLESAHEFMIENGWTEEAPADSLEDVMDEMRDALSCFPGM